MFCNYKTKFYKMANAFILLVISIFIYGDIMAEKKNNGAAVSYGTIRVCSYIDENDVNNLNEVHIADIVIYSNGEIVEKSNSQTGRMMKFRDILLEVQSKKFLSLKASTLKDIDGEQVPVLTYEDIYPSDPRYIWAVSSFLRNNYDFNCEVLPNE